MKKFVAVMVVVNQYAEGICGQNLYLYVFASPDRTGFNSKKEASVAFINTKKINKYKTKANQTGLGYYYSKPVYLSVDEFENESKTGNYYFTHGTKIYIN